ncbi:MAG: DUF1049 domain-containing protein [Xanthobacteraceae bacterium]|nr:DUF1049 domain-containing protein [Xanthobacteraceae bacterium]QYK45066.1 MAG: DUF1049 domain-containing protein [Xanthobacteraceae bacterium]
MRNLFRWLLLIPLGIALVLLAVANRAPVTLSIDPFSPESPAFAIKIPLFVALLLAVVLGVVIGGAAAGIGRMRWRHRARSAEREAKELQARNEEFLRGPASESRSREVALR